jgi:hypothetical protein
MESELLLFEDFRYFVCSFRFVFSSLFFFSQKGNVSLRQLVLDSNRIDDDGISALVGALGMHPSLVELSLVDNEIGPPGLAVLCNALCKEALSLHVLNLGTNFIQKEGVTSLATLLSKNKTLIDLNVSYNSLGGSRLDSVIVLSKGFDGIISLAESLTMNSTLLSLNLKGNNVSKNGMRAFSDAIAANKILCRIQFDDADHIEQMDGGFKKNFSITEVGCEMPSSVNTFIQRNRKERDAFAQAVGSGDAVAKVKAIVDKGVDVMEMGALGLLKTPNPELISLFHTAPHIRNLLFSSPAVLDLLKDLSEPVLKALAKEVGGLTCLLYAARAGRKGGFF